MKTMKVDIPVYAKIDGEFYRLVAIEGDEVCIIQYFPFANEGMKPLKIWQNKSVVDKES